MHQEMRLEFDSVGINEKFARIVVAAFMTRLDPSMEELSDVKTAVSEAVTNAIIHGYNEGEGKIVLEASVEANQFTVTVEDFGVGIENVKRAMEPLYTTRGDLERSGMGFVFMEAFMDSIQVSSKLGKGTKVSMTKNIQPRNQEKE